MSAMLRHASRWLAWLEEAALTLLVLTIILLACVQIGLRSLFASGLSWADPLLRHLVLWAGLLGAVAATRTGKHIAMDLVSHFLPRPLNRRLGVLMDLVAALVCLVLSWTAIRFVREVAAYDSGQTIVGLASWQLHLIFPIAFALVTLRFLERACHGLVALLNGESA
ncbi:MAG: TRAP transporter small permease [Thermodesulfobacteriota bacterium]